MSSMSEVRALMARVLVARGVADPAAFDRFPETTAEPLPGVRRGRLVARVSLVVSNLRERVERAADLPVDLHRIARSDAPGGVFLPFRNLKELHR